MPWWAGGVMRWGPPKILNLETLNPAGAPPLTCAPSAEATAPAISAPQVPRRLAASSPPAAARARNVFSWVSGFQAPSVRAGAWRRWDQAGQLGGAAVALRRERGK